MKANELRSKSSSDLGKMLSDLKREWMNLRFQVASRDLNNTSVISKVKKNIARVMTILNEKKNMGEV